MVAGIDRKDLKPHELGKIGEDWVEEKMKSQGIEVIGRHFAYRVEGLDGHGFTDVVGRKGKYLYIWEAKNGKCAGPTKFQGKSFPLMRENRNIKFFGPKAEEAGLPFEWFNEYYFDEMHCTIPK